MKKNKVIVTLRTDPKKYVKTSDNIRIWYQLQRAENNPSSRTIVFIHGWMANASLWYPYRDFFIHQGWDCLLIDLRGHGFSQKPQDKKKYTITRFCTDIYEVLHKLSIKNAVIVGHSMGGMVALQFARKYKKICHSLILIDTTYRNPLLDSQSYYKFIKPKFAKIIIKELSKLPTRKTTIPDNRVIDKTMHLGINKILFDRLHAHSRHTLFSFDAMLKFNETHNLPKITQQTLLICGKKDTLTPLSTMQTMQSHMPHATLKVLPYQTHSAPVRAHKKISKMMLTFFTILDTYPTKQTQERVIRRKVSTQ